MCEEERSQTMQSPSPSQKLHDLPKSRASIEIERMGSNSNRPLEEAIVRRHYTALFYVLLPRILIYHIFHLPSTCLRLTNGARAPVATASPAIVRSKDTLLNPLSSTSNAMLGLTRVPNKSCPYPTTRLVLSSKDGVLVTFSIPITSMACVRYHCGASSRYEL